MPELPEVEHIVRYLSPHLVSKWITAIEVLDPKARRRPPHDRALQPDDLVGRRIRAIRRRAKLIFLDLDREPGLAFHLKLTGKLSIEPARSPRSRWVRLVIVLGRDELRFEDTRRLGWFDLVDATGREAIVATLGPEPLEPGFTLEVLTSRLARRRGPVKPILLDPAFVAGIGNIYADEILHAARLHPLRRVESLSPREIARVHAEIIEVLRRAVGERSGKPGQDRVGSGSRTASKELTLSVFQKTGEPCPACSAVIERIVVRGRGTHLCPKCQPLPGGAGTPVARSRRGATDPERSRSSKR
jgi:formamidopyrimidine-DNA glycosylase